MPKQRIDILLPESRLAADPEHRQLLDLLQNKKRPPRTPVILNIDEWHCLGARGGTVSDYLASPRDNLRGQLLNLKWRLENIPDDQPLPTQLALQPDFGAIRGTQFPLTWHETDAGPWVCDTLLTQPEQIDTLEIPASDANLNAKRIAWFHDMQTLVEDFDLRLNGQPIPLKINISHGGGPIPTAFALAGENLFEWMASEPDRAHRLMHIATESHIQCVQFHHQLAGRKPDAPVWTGADSAEMISPTMFKEFVVPYYLRLWSAFPGPRTFHMCGRINHLLDLLRDDMKIDILDGFGFPVPPELLAEKLGHRVQLKGGPSPMLLNTGPLEAIQQETTRYMNLLAPTGNFIMSLGGNAVIGTPPAHLQSLITTARNWSPA